MMIRTMAPSPMYMVPPFACLRCRKTSTRGCSVPTVAPVMALTSPPAGRLAPFEATTSATPLAKGEEP